MEDTKTPTHAAASAFETRAATLRTRVADAARALSERGIKPTVARIRAALGGGSPNDLTPALKAWREASPREGGEVAQGPTRAGRIPPPIVDLAQELWQRATAAAVLELKHGPTAQAMAARTGEIQALRSQLSAVREQLERESRAYGELRAQAARHETIAQLALARAEQAETRLRDLLRELGEARQDMAQLTAGRKQRRRSADPATAFQGRNAARQNQRPTSRSKRTPRVRATSLTRRPAVQKRSAQRSRDTSKTVMVNRKKGPGTRLTRQKRH